MCCWRVACGGGAGYAAGDGAEDSGGVRAVGAQLRAVSDKVAEADEGKLDTERIQTALDKCKPGMAVELKPASGNNAFLTGPLEMRTGVTLLVDEGVTLFGSRDAAVYEVEGRRGDAGVVRDDRDGRSAGRCFRLRSGRLRCAEGAGR